MIISKVTVCYNFLMSGQKIITRFAPSPTGLLHLGGARTALFNYLFARRNNGKVILRIEDTDKERSKPEYQTDITENLKWLGIDFDKTYVQSQNIELHKKYLKNLLDSGRAYISKETPAETGDREEVIRFRNPGRVVEFEDLIKGKISFDTSELKDFVIAKSVDEPLFHLAVVADDFEMGVSHVIRGEDHISNTPRQILIQEAIGAPRPRYAHIPLILAPDRSKLSKRKHGESASVRFYRNEGYEPEAVVNYLALLGWNPGTNEEFFSLPELVKHFSLERVQKGGAVFDVDKLNWMNKEYLKRRFQEGLPPPQIIPEEIARGKTPAQLLVLWKTVFERANTLGEINRSLKSGGEFYYLNVAARPEYNAKKLLWKNSGEKLTRLRLEHIRKIIEELAESEFNPAAIKEALWPYAEENGRGEVLWPLRFALSGKDRSPDPFTLAAILGKGETLNRVSAAAKKLQ